MANGGERSRRAADGRVTVDYAETEPISTYLFAFTAGRFAVETAISFNLPAFTCATAAGNPEKKKSTWPPSRSFKAGPAPL